MPYRPRDMRFNERRHRASKQARMAGKSAIDCALAEIATIYDRADRINSLKMRVDVVLSRGPASEDVRCWYSILTSMMRRANVRTISRAIQLVVAEMIRTIMIENELGGPRLLVKRDTLDEAMLALRWLRRHRPSVDVRALVEDMARGPGRSPIVFLAAAE